MTREDGSSPITNAFFFLDTLMVLVRLLCLFNQGASPSERDRARCDWSEIEKSRLETSCVLEGENAPAAAR
jgi:hypothetical protein